MKRTRWESNEILLTTDVENNGTYGLENFDETFGIIGATTIVKGFDVTQSVTPAMSVLVSAGIAYDLSEEHILVNLEDITATVAESSATLDRLDTVRMRRVINEENLQSRQFKDPGTGDVTVSNIKVEEEYTVEVEVVTGNPGSTTAPDVDTGWIKIAELLVPAGSTTVVNTNIYNVDAPAVGQNNTDWTNDTATIYQNGTLSEIQNTVWGYSQSFTTNSLTVTGLSALNTLEVSGISVFDNSLTITDIATFQSGGIEFEEPLTISDDNFFQITLDRTANAGVGHEYTIGISTLDAIAIYNKTDSSYLATFHNDGSVVFGGNVSNGVDGIQAWEDTDKSFVFGRAKLGYATSGSTDHMYLAHYNRFTSTDYAFRQNSAGTTYINANSSASVRIMNNNVAVGVFESDAITMYEPLNINDSGATDQGIIDFTRGSSTYGEDASRDYRLQNDTGQFKLLSNETTNGELTYIQTTGSIISLSPNQDFNVLVGTTTDNGDLFQVAPASDITAFIGAGKMGYIASSDSFYICQRDHFSATNYNLLLASSGSTFVNAKSTGTVYIRNANSDVATFSGSAITMEKPLTISANNNRMFISSSQYILMGSDSFSDTEDRYRLWYDGGNLDMRFDTRTTGQNHVWGSWNSGGTLLSHMELTGDGNLLLNETNNGTDKLRVGGSGYFSDDLTVDGQGSFGEGRATTLTYQSNNVTAGTLYTNLSAVLPSDSTPTRISGCMVPITGDTNDRDVFIFSYVVYNGSSVTLYGSEINFANGAYNGFQGIESVTLTSGGTTTYQISYSL